MPKFLASIVFVVAVALAGPVQAERFAVIVGSQHQGTIDLDEVAKIFLGKHTPTHKGNTLTPLNLDPADPAYAAFARQVLRKSRAQLRAYWAKQIFTGQGKPPKVIKTAREVRELVASNRDYVAYVNVELIDESVRPIAILEY